MERANPGLDAARRPAAAQISMCWMSLPEPASPRWRLRPMSIPWSARTCRRGCWLGLHQRAEAEGITNVTWTEAPAEALPFPDATFCLVTCRIAPHHFLDLAQFLRETTRVLKPGGHLVLVDTTVPDDSPEAAELAGTPWKFCATHLMSATTRRPNGANAGRSGGADRETKSPRPMGGITIPLSDWLFKAGCTPDAGRQVCAKCSPTLPESAQSGIPDYVAQPDGETVFTWQRVALHAMKPKI